MGIQKKHYKFNTIGYLLLCISSIFWVVTLIIWQIPYSQATDLINLTNTKPYAFSMLFSYALLIVGLILIINFISNKNSKIVSALLVLGGMPFLIFYLLQILEVSYKLSIFSPGYYSAFTLAAAIGAIYYYYIEKGIGRTVLAIGFIVTFIDSLYFWIATDLYFEELFATVLHNESLYFWLSTDAGLFKTFQILDIGASLIIALYCLFRLVSSNSSKDKLTTSY